MNKIGILSVINDDGIDIEKLLLLVFRNYETKKNNNTLYSYDDFEPKGLIKLYYQITDKPKFEGLYTKFKRKYILNENKLEAVHRIEEIEGLGLVYEYIQGDIPIKNINVYMICMLHSILYSKTPFPEFGGKFRNRDVYLPGAAIETESYDNVPVALQKLFLSTNELVQKGLELKNNKNINKIIEYIDECIELKSELIRIHPFFDGNGRTCRAFLNLLFKLAGVPPVYVREKEREEYNKAMNKAINEKDFTTLKKFYYYKICDSIFELDIKEKLEQLKKTKSR